MIGRGMADVIRALAPRSAPTPRALRPRVRAAARYDRPRENDDVRALIATVLARGDGAGRAARAPRASARRRRARADGRRRDRDRRRRRRRPRGGFVGAMRALLDHMLASGGAALELDVAAAAPGERALAVAGTFRAKRTHAQVLDALAEMLAIAAAHADRNGGVALLARDDGARGRRRRGRRGGRRRRRRG